MIFSSFRVSRWSYYAGTFLFLVLVSVTLRSAETPAEKRWFKGNLHTHSLWSDGDDYPEMIVDWYKSHDYQFLALSDHNLIQEGDRWINIKTNKGGQTAFDKYVKCFGDQVERRDREGRQEVRLKTLE